MHKLNVFTHLYLYSTQHKHSYASVNPWLVFILLIFTHRFMIFRLFYDNTFIFQLNLLNFGGLVLFILLDSGCNNSYSFRCHKKYKRNRSRKIKFIMFDSFEFQMKTRFKKPHLNRV